MPPSALGAPVEVVRLASDDWCPYVCSHAGKIEGGFVVEVASRALAATGFRVETHLLPLSRALHQTEAGNIDGVFAPPGDARLLPSGVLAYSRACFFTTAKSAWSFWGIQSLNGMRLGAIGDYGYDQGAADRYILANSANRSAIDFSYGATAGQTNAKKLLQGRFPVLIEHDLVMNRIVADMNAEGQFRNAGCVDLPFALRVGFALHHPHSQVWIAALAVGIRKLERSGEMDKICEHYGVKLIDEHRRKGAR